MSVRHAGGMRVVSAKPGFVRLLLLLLLAFFTANASAAQITYISIDGIWHDPTDNVAGSQPGEPVITNGVPTSIIRWGTTSGTPQSGYDITTTLPPPQTFPGPAPLFSLGSFTHRNFEVSPPSLTSVQLDVVLMLSVDGVPTGPLTFTYTFNHEETPNNTTPCPYPTPPGEGCTDRVTIVSSAQPTTFQIDGVDYTLSLNFLVDGNPVSEFITREGGTTNTSGLVGQFTLPPGTPQMMVMKSGPATMNPGVPGDFVINAQNTGVYSAYNVTLLDRLPNGPTGGMCDTAPQVLSARVFAADGTTPVPGKGPLVQGADYSLAFDGVTCELTFRTLTAASVVGVGERLIIAYRTQLDADTQNGITLTNVAGATEWYNDFGSNPGRSSYTRTLTDGTVDAFDHEDAHTVNVMPRLYAEKAVALQLDSMSPGLVDPGDVLRYTIRIHNYSLLPFTQAMLRDMVPPNTTYVADTMTLNGQPVRRPDGGISPLIAGVDVSSSNLTPPLPGTGAGILSAGQMAVIQFDLRVNDGTPPGTVIRNQATVTTAELPSLLTDGDGNPATGPEPTVVVVAGPQLMRITKDVAVVGGGPANAGATLEYVVRATNSGTVPAYAVVIRDDLAVPNPGYLTFVNGSYTMNDSTDGITVVDSLLTADFSTTYGALPPGGTVTLRFRAVLNANLAIGTKVTNTGKVYWNDPQQTASASVSIDVGGMVGFGILNGRAWHDANFNKVFDATERVLEHWSVELYRNGTVAYTATTDATGTYVIGGVTPNYQTQDRYELRFTAPGAGARTAKLGRADSAFGNGLQKIYDIVVQPGSNLLNLNLPIEPNGVIYNSMSRAPIPGATVTMVQAGSRAALPESCFDDPAQQGQAALAQGYYRFDLNFADPACPTGGDFALEVTAPGPGYVAGYSQIIPPAATDATQPFSVPSCPGSADDAIPATAQRCEVQPSEIQPGAAIAARTIGTIYHVHLTFDDGQVPGSSQIFNNHIPVDPVLDAALAVTKTTPLLNVSRGQLVPYTITVRNVMGMPLQDVRVADRFPAGFHYVPGSAQIDGAKVEPVVAGRELYWNNLSFNTNDQHTVVLLLTVGTGVSEGEFVNRAQAVNAFTGRALSSEATATVRIVPDPTFDCTDVTGKVFDDANRNGLQEAGEDGLAGVRLVTTNGLVALTDAYGRFHITCAATPHEGRGSNFVLKLDDRTLPSGYRASTDQVVMQRATRGKTLRFSFGASIHRAVSLDLADAVFEKGTTEIRLQWQSRMDLLLAELRKAPSVLRLSYLADVEDEQLVQRRLKAVKQQILDAWKTGDSGYALEVEPEVFWRRGGPAKPVPAGAGR
jgi:uncharacterized repeat protein (TIGR01451 family)/fimbrial isopeptide formation D2 family protein